MLLFARETAAFLTKGWRGACFEQVRFYKLKYYNPGPETVRRRLVLWFRNDLRLHDNNIVHTAIKVTDGRGAKYKEVVPLYCFDPRSFSRNVLDHETGLKGEPKIGKYRAKFLLESVLDLKQNLKEIGSDLIIRIGKPEDVIPEFITDSSVVFMNEETTFEEKKVQDAVINAIRKVGASYQLYWSHTMYHPDDLLKNLAMRDVAEIYVKFKDQLEGVFLRTVRRGPRRGEIPLPLFMKDKDFTPTWEDLPLAESVRKEGPPEQHPEAVVEFKGGESAAMERIKYYVWDTKLVQLYKKSRNQLLGGDFSSKLSPWFAHGCLSPKLLFHIVKQYELEHEGSSSTEAFIDAIQLRDFYKFMALKHGNHIFLEGGPLYKHQHPVRDQDELFERWKAGKTGVPFVDANMRELKLTGYMSSRGRSNAAHFLVHDLGVDWRRGADWFEHCLIDYDAASNWGNWVVAADLMTTPWTFPNIIKQSMRYDPNGEYIRTWVKELEHVPGNRIHRPWLLTKDEEFEYKCTVGADYPHRVKTRQPLGSTASYKRMVSRTVPLPRKPKRPKTYFDYAKLPRLE